MAWTEEERNDLIQQKKAMIECIEGWYDALIDEDWDTVKTYAKDFETFMNQLGEEFNKMGFESMDDVYGYISDAADAFSEEQEYDDGDDEDDEDTY